MRLPGEMLLYCWGISDKDHSHPSPFSLKAAQSSAGISPQCFRANCTDRSQTATLLFSTLAQPPPPLTSCILSISLSTVATNSYYRVCHVTRELLHPSSFSISPLQFPHLQSPVYPLNFNPNSQPRQCLQAPGLIMLSLKLLCSVYSS